MKNYQQINNIILYNRALDILGGGELSTTLLSKALCDIFPKAQVKIITFEHDKNRQGKIKVYSVTELENAFGIRIGDRVKVERLKAPLESVVRSKILKKIHMSLLEYKLKKISMKCELFINHTYWSEFVSKADVNIYFCMFPHVTSNLKFIQKYNKIIANSEFTKKFIKQKWLCDSDVLYPYAIENVPPYNNFNKRENLIVNIGRFFKDGHIKRQDIIIKIFKTLINKYNIRGWELILIGRCAEKDKDFLEELKQESKGYNVKFFVNIPENEKIEILNKCKIYIHATGYGLSETISPEKMEHFGISVAEAKIRGIVPLCINRGGIKELISDGVDGYLFNNFNDCMEKLLACIQNDTLLKKMSLKAYKNAVQKFSYESYVKSLRTSLSSLFNF